MTGHHHHDEPIVALTRNQSLVLGALRSAERPLSAYAILDELRSEGLKAPLQIYRALDKLIASGNVHRLETLNAFVACSHGGCGAHTATGFMICESCGTVTEFEDEELANDLTDRGDDRGFSVRKASIELIGACTDCREIQPHA